MGYLAQHLAAVLAGLAFAGSVGAAETPPRDCFDQLSDAALSRIDCSFPVRMTDEERAEVRKLTRDFLEDAHCEVAIAIERSVVDAAMAEGDHLFEAPPQPTACEVVTSGGILPVAMTFAPKVTFKAGVAVAASPGMGNVTGVNSWLAWPVVTWVNTADMIEEPMLKIVNAYVRRQREQRAERAAAEQTAAPMALRSGNHASFDKRRRHQDSRLRAQE